MLIDMHVHTCLARHPRITRPNGSRYPTPERLIEMMDEAGIDKAVLMCVASPECRYTLVQPEEVIGIAARYPERLVPFCSLDPRNLTNDPGADFRPLLLAYRELGCRGVGEYIPNLPVDDPLNLRLFAQVEEIGLPLTFHLAPRAGGFYGMVDELGLPRLERVLRTFPRLVLLGHSQVFWSEISADVTEGNRGGYPTGPVAPGRVVELMRRYPNLHGDLSAGSGLNAIQRDARFARGFLEEFQDRLYFGTDIANDPQQLPIVGHIRRLRDEGTLSREAYEKVSWRNAARLLNLIA
jgi:predicted TIM-barrel fold metal-dependent hydrolase